jgi:hypothetical protein
VANLVRSKTIVFDDATISVAFGLCWDGVKA